MKKKLSEEEVQEHIITLGKHLRTCIELKRNLGKEKCNFTTQADDMEIKPGTLSRYQYKDAEGTEQGGVEMTMGVDKLIRICEYFDVSADYMLGLTSDSKLMRRHTPDDATIKQMCDYTGLSRQAIETLHTKKEDFLFSACLTYLLSANRNLLSSVIEYILTCLHNVTAEDKRYSLLPAISSTSEAGKHFFYDVIE